ncbi:MAG: Hint domain-containing homing endonuclease [Elusimicrobiota bacterium]
MKKLRALGLLLTAAALVVAGLSMQSLAKEKAKKSKKKDLTVTVKKPEPPTCSISCSPSNLRASGGWLTASWNSNAGRVDLSGPSGSESNVGKSGSRRYGRYGHYGPHRASITCSADDGGVASASCQSILSCFLAGTKILLEDGSYKNIEDVKIGDKVMSYDAEAGLFVGSSVVETLKTQSQKYFVVNDTLKITPTHVLYVNGQWKPSETMKVGDTLLNANGEPQQITSLKEITEDVQVYNLYTNEPNDFFADNFLVHNENEGEQDHKDRGIAKGIKIAMIDGRALEVEKVKAGDKVLSYDPKKKRYTINVVRKTASQQVGKTLLINGKLRIAVAHPVFLVDNAPAKKK